MATEKGGEPFLPQNKVAVLDAIEDIERMQREQEQARNRFNESINAMRTQAIVAVLEHKDEIRRLSEGVRAWLNQLLRQEKLTPGRKEVITNYLTYLDKIDSFEFSEGCRLPGRFNIAGLGQVLPNITFELPGPCEVVDFSDSSSIAEGAEKLRAREEKAGRRLGAALAVRMLMGENLDVSSASSIAVAAIAFQEMEAKAGRNILISDAVRQVVEKC